MTTEPEAEPEPQPPAAATTNAAERLLAILDALGEEHTNIATRSIFARTLFGKHVPDYEILRVIVDLIALVEQVQADVKRIPGVNSSMYLRWVTPLTHALRDLEVHHAWPTVRPSLIKTERRLALLRRSNP